VCTAHEARDGIRQRNAFPSKGMLNPEHREFTCFRMSAHLFVSGFRLRVLWLLLLLLLLLRLLLLRMLQWRCCRRRRRRRRMVCQCRRRASVAAGVQRPPVFAAAMQLTPTLRPVLHAALAAAAAAAQAPVLGAAPAPLTVPVPPAAAMTASRAAASRWMYLQVLQPRQAQTLPRRALLVLLNVIKKVFGTHVCHTQRAERAKPAARVHSQK